MFNIESHLFHFEIINFHLKLNAGCDVSIPLSRTILFWVPSDIEHPQETSKNELNITSMLKALVQKDLCLLSFGGGATPQEVVKYILGLVLNH